MRPGSVGRASTLCIPAVLPAYDAEAATAKHDSGR
jgi:hypothetical protein